MLELYKNVQFQRSDGNWVIRKIIGISDEHLKICWIHEDGLHIARKVIHYSHVFEVEEEPNHNLSAQSHLSSQKPLIQQFYHLDLNGDASAQNKQQQLKTTICNFVEHQLDLSVDSHRHIPQQTTTSTKSTNIKNPYQSYDKQHIVQSRKTFESFPRKYLPRLIKRHANNKICNFKTYVFAAFILFFLFVIGLTCFWLLIITTIYSK